MQVLEGEEQLVRSLYTKISADPRHKGALALLQGVEEKRQFADWSMGFRDLNSPEVAATSGFKFFCLRIFILLNRPGCILAGEKKREEALVSLRYAVEHGLSAEGLLKMERTRSCNRWKGRRGLPSW